MSEIIESLFVNRLFVECHGWRYLLWFQLLVKLSRKSPLIGLTLFGVTFCYGPRLKKTATYFTTGNYQ